MKTKFLKKFRKTHQSYNIAQVEVQHNLSSKTTGKRAIKVISSSTSTSASNAYNMDSPIRDLINELYEKGINESSSSSSGNGCTNIENKQIINTDNKLVEETLVSTSNNSSPVHLVTIRIKPDTEGKFGFNFKGGADQNCEILISRVAPNTPADNAQPIRLNEGDQVLVINGREVKGLKHDEVVDLIRSTNDIGEDAELCLIIRPLGMFSIL